MMNVRHFTVLKCYAWDVYYVSRCGKNAKSRLLRLIEVQYWKLHIHSFPQLFSFNNDVLELPILQAKKASFMKN